MVRVRSSNTLVRMMTFVTFVSLCLLLTLATAEAKSATAVLADPLYTDTQSNTEGEVYNMVGLIESLGWSVFKITDLSSQSQWTSAMEQSRAILITEYESGASKRGDPHPVTQIPEATRDAVRSWVTGQNGTVIIFYGDDSYMNYFLDIDIAKRASPHEKRGGGEYPKTEAANATELFFNAPDELASIDACSSQDIRPAIEEKGDAVVCLYGTDESCAAWMFPEGDGHWFGVCVDYYDAKPRGEQDGGWVDVLTLMIGNNSSGSMLTSWLSALLHLLHHLF